MTDPPALVTLTTDFGEQDAYVAAMKGVILSRAPRTAVIDLSHAIPPQACFEAAYFLAGAVPWFPPGAVHVVVVDPGVGTERRAIAARWRDQILIAPDNGVLTLLDQQRPLDAVRRIDHPDCRLEPMSATFHGRDLFAPTAGLIAAGFPFKRVGPLLADPVHLPLARPETRPEGIVGAVIHIDRFGNAITNLPADRFSGDQPVRITAGTVEVTDIRRTYGDAAPGETLALIGSTGHLEIAVNQGHAAQRLGLHRGMAVWVRPIPSDTCR